MFDHGLTEHQLAMLKQVLSTYADIITRVDLFGSRAKGAYRSNSDIDLVLHGVIDEKIIDRLWTIFSESALALKVDVKSYELTTYPPLKTHMDTVCETLFEQSELLDVKKHQLRKIERIVF